MMNYSNCHILIVGYTLISVLCSKLFISCATSQRFFFFLSGRPGDILLTDLTCTPNLLPGLTHIFILLYHMYIQFHNGIGYLYLCSVFSYPFGFLESLRELL